METRFEDVCELGEGVAVDDTAAVVLCFEVRIRKTEEDLGQRPFAEEIGDALHRVGPHHCYVLCARRHMHMSAALR